MYMRVDERLANLLKYLLFLLYVFASNSSVYDFRFDVYLFVVCLCVIHRPTRECFIQMETSQIQ